MQKNREFYDLMTELCKKNPSVPQLQKLCRSLKISFNGNIVDLMSEVLFYSNKVKNDAQKSPLKNKKKRNNEINI